MQDKFVKTLKPAAADEIQPCFKLEPNQLQAVMLRLELLGGACFALPYAHLSSVELKPMLGMELVYSTHRVLVQGRNLQPLFDMLSRNRVEAIREHPSLVDHFPESATVINTLLIETI